ncbi:ANTAR domain-containing response regulator [Gordoniibacillus kamchatkensis]|uniref:ANTAR domain-containing response regulator n=1 Tax=Gordoniibacillus kamchatkensis TaxID=1590651 RepID=UPI0009E36428|nr:ANTAR domain-containing protein [Paenibacillus sp. VKM B-2647]
MIQTFLLVDEYRDVRTRFAPAPADSDGEDAAGPDSGAAETVPEKKLRDLGLRVIAASAEPREFAAQLEAADAALLSVPAEGLAAWRKKVLALRPVPVLLWCDDLTFPSQECKLDVELDGLLSANMSAIDLHASLLIGFNHFLQRREWLQEREQLLSRLEERKWIDQAKGILCEIKGISEAEAYDFLRKQAMNERKRMVDVATSIVKVYQLLQDQNSKGGRKR